MRRPRLSPALFALICMSFVLPFATVSCDGTETSFTGCKAKGPGWCAAGGFAAMLGIAIQGFQPLGPTVTFRIGYWLILLLFFLLIVVHGVQARRRRAAARLEAG